MDSPAAILIVEDHTMIAEYLTSVLANAGYEPIQAATLTQARTLLAQRVFDLWICDLHLPDGDGNELIAERSGHHASTPAIALSADLTADTRRQLLAQGFIEALDKPCQAGLMKTTVARVLSAHGRRPAAAEQPGPGYVLPVARAPVLDDEAALRVCGSPETMARLRRLLAAELDRLQPELVALWHRRDTVSLETELHKFAASAAWCGATEAERAGACFRAMLASGAADEPKWQQLWQALQRLRTELADSMVTAD